MGSQARNSATAEDADFKAVKARFFALNRARLQRAAEAMRPRQREFLELLPLVFHINHPMLPGFVGKEAPVGIPDYAPGKTAIATARRHAQSFAFRRRAYRKFDIRGIYVMGSVGTIAYTDDSDLDVWICYDSQLDATQVALLEKKARRVERWARELGVNATLFLVDPERFREGKHGKLTSESSGSALHSLLLDEFYRTGLLLAGLYPLWWLVPPADESDYEAYAADVKRKRFVHAKEHIDFGSPHSIAAEEFYGATLWLLYKGIDSPYKSLLKVMLMEAYANEYPEIELLSMNFKRQVYEGVDDPDAVDPYLMLLHKVEEHLERRGELERQELARRCLYFKVNERLSAPVAQPRCAWRRTLLEKLVKRWQWSVGTLVSLDSRDTWKLPRVRREHSELVNEFTQSYRFLSSFARSHAASIKLIDPADLNLLGRKLYAAFERKAGKVDIIGRGIPAQLHESHVTLAQVSDATGPESWLLFSGVIKPADMNAHEPLKRAPSVVELLAWCHFNGLVSRNTVFALHGEDTALSTRELLAILDSMERLFPLRQIESLPMRDLSHSPQVVALGSYLNVGLDPLANYTRRGQHLTSERTDALKYGGLSENLALSIDQVVLTSWHEVMTYRYVGVSGLFDCLADMMRWAPPSSGHTPPPLTAFSYSSTRGQAIAGRVEQLFADVMRAFYDSRGARALRYLVGVERHYYVLWLNSDALNYQRLHDYEALLRYLGEPQHEFSRMLVDPQALENDVLALLLERNQPGIVQVYCESSEGGSKIWILDEKGSLFCDWSDEYDADSVLAHYEHFLEAAHKRMSFASVSNPMRVAFHRVEKLSDGKRHIYQHSLTNHVRPSHHFDVQVIGRPASNTSPLRIYCDGEEFSSLQYGERIYEAVAHHVLTRRRSGEDYPVYVSDVDAPPAASGDEASLQTNDYLNYKQRIEQHLRRAIG